LCACLYQCLVSILLIPPWPTIAIGRVIQESRTRYLDIFRVRVGYYVLPHMCCLCLRLPHLKHISHPTYYLLCSVTSDEAPSTKLLLAHLCRSAFGAQSSTTAQRCPTGPGLFSAKYSDHGNQGGDAQRPTGDGSCRIRIHGDRTYRR
jgi:hypothetical protein